MEKTVIEYLEELKIKNKESVGATRRLDIIENKFKELQETVNKYKNIEEELGIDLETFFKILNERTAFYKGAAIPIWYNPYQVGEYKKSDIRGISLSNLHKSNRGNWCFDSYDEHNKLAPRNLFLKDYGKTWALTKEELEGK